MSQNQYECSDGICGGRNLTYMFPNIKNCSVRRCYRAWNVCLVCCNSTFWPLIFHERIVRLNVSTRSLLVVCTCWIK